MIPMRIPGHSEAPCAPTPARLRMGGARGASRARGRQGAVIALAALGAALSVPPALAQSWPARPVRMIVPFGAGGASDFVARIIAPKLQDTLGQPVVVENRAGAGGNLGLELAARAAPDGYSVFLGNVGTLAVNPHVFGAALKVDPLRDLAPVGLVSDTTTMLLVHPSLPVRSVKELIAFARARPGQLNYASAGPGSLSHLQMELLAGQAGLSLVHIPYKSGAGQAVGDVVAGQVTVTIQTLTSVVGFVASGKLRPLAVTTAKRLPAYPAVPTLREQGMDIVSSSWQGLLVPAGTPPEPIRRLHAAIASSLPVPDVRERFATGATEVLLSGSPAEFGEFMRAESQRWAKVVRAAGVRAD